MRLIDADAAFERIDNAYGCGNIVGLKQIIDSIPTIDTVRHGCTVNRYNPVCPIGKTDCVNDPANIHYYHPEQYKEVYGDMTPDKVAEKYCSPCVINGCYCHDYDIEDK